MTYRYRPDGWPICPACGEDELASAAMFPEPNDPMRCLACGWEGRVPTHRIWPRFAQPDAQEGVL